MRNKPMPKIKVNCKMCAKEFFTLPSYIRRGGGKYCSTACSYKRDYVFSPEHRRKIGDANSRRIVSLETRLKMAEKAIGRLVSEQTKEKLRIRMLGNKHTLGFSPSEETRKKMSLAQKGKHEGKNNPMWKGGITPENEVIRRSEEYKTWRDSVFERDGYTCQNCGAKSGNGETVYLQADHIKPFSKYPDLRFDHSNGRTLCKSCHYLIGWNIFRTDERPDYRKGLA